MTSRMARVVLVLLALCSVLCHSTAIAGSLCYGDRAVSAQLEAVTGKASATFLEAASAAFSAFKALDEGSDAFGAHASRTRELLERTIAGYKQALMLSEALTESDSFLRARPFDGLRAKLGITPGTLNHARWDMFAKLARESTAPTADLLTVCIAGAESLRSSMASAKAGMPPSLLRRMLYAWSLVLSHGALVSDAFDASIR